MKKIISVIISVMIFVSFSLTSYAAFDTDYMLVFGDANTVGTGLSDNKKNDVYASKKNAVNIIAEKNELKAEKNYFNFSDVNYAGYDIVSAITNGDGDIFMRADTLILSMFQKEMTDTFRDIFLTAVENEQETLSNLKINYQEEDSFEQMIEILKSLKKINSDESKACLERISSEFREEKISAVTDMVCGSMQSELREILSYLYDTQNSQVNIYILDNFDPLSNLEISEEINAYFKNFCDKIKNIILQEHEYNPEKVFLIDIYESFLSVNNSITDYSMNDQGHAILSELLQTAIGNAQKGTHNTVIYSSGAQRMIGEGSYSIDEPSEKAKEESVLSPADEQKQDAARKAYLGVICALLIGFGAIASIAGINYGKKKND